MMATLLAGIAACLWLLAKVIEAENRAAALVWIAGRPTQESLAARIALLRKRHRGMLFGFGHLPPRREVLKRRALMERDVRAFSAEIDVSYDLIIDLLCGEVKAVVLAHLLRNRIPQNEAAA